MRSIDRRQLLAVLVAVMCATALPGSSAAAGGGEVRMPSKLATSPSRQLWRTSLLEAVAIRPRSRAQSVGQPRVAVS